jgi:hypothetical protein
MREAQGDRSNRESTPESDAPNNGIMDKDYYDRRATDRFIAAGRRWVIKFQA